MQSRPLRFLSPGGYDIYVGKNDRQNDQLTMRTASKDDIWFHAQKIPGSHVLLVTGGVPLDDIDDETIVMAAELERRIHAPAMPEKPPSTIHSGKTSRRGASGSGKA